MSNSDLSLIDEFVKETLELLTQLGEACGRLKSDATDQTQLATIDRGLHTLKGNAAALGLAELSQAAAALLERWRAESSSTLMPVWRFLAECRRYVVLVGAQRTPESGFFERLAQPQALSVERSGPRKAPTREVAVSLVERESSIDEILASVPELAPDISGLVSKAAEHLKAQGITLVAQPPAEAALAVQSPPDKQPRKSGGNPAHEDLSALRSHEVDRQLQQLQRRLAQQGIAAPELESALQFLEHFQDGHAARRRVALQQFLQGAVDDVGALGRDVRRNLRGKVVATEIHVLAALGELIRYQLTEILRNRLCQGRLASQEPQVDYSVQASADGDELLLVMRGLGSRPRSSALERLRLQSSMEFLKDLQGTLRHGDQVGELEFSLNIGAVFSSEVCLLETADARFYLPASCVASSGDLHPGSTEIVVRTSGGPRRLQLRAMEEKETLLVAAADDELAAAGMLGHCLSLRRSERIPLLDPDSL